MIYLKAELDKNTRDVKATEELFAVSASNKIVSTLPTRCLQNDRYPGSIFRSRIYRSESSTILAMHSSMIKIGAICNKCCVMNFLSENPTIHRKLFVDVDLKST